MLVLCLGNDEVISSAQGDHEGNHLLDLTPSHPESCSLIPPDSLWATTCTFYDALFLPLSLIVFDTFVTSLAASPNFLSPSLQTHPWALLS